VKWKIEIELTKSSNFISKLLLYSVKSSCYLSRRSDSIMHDRQTYILLTIDVEDWFQVENFKRYIPFSSWPSYELRVEKNTYRLLDLLDSCSSTHNAQLAIRSPIKATFFVLGWIAERLPHLVREIHSRGHEVASHSYLHNMCNEQPYEDLKKDFSGSKKLLEDITGSPVYGLRAPNFSISDDILKIIEECGYLYDSSFNSFVMRGRYGQIDLSQSVRNGIAAKISDKFYELPISNLKFAHQVFPWGGGGYFRFIPFTLFKIGIKFILGQEKAYLFYFHPWEIDPEQPKVNQASSFYKFLHYINLRKTHKRLSKLIENFAHCNFITCNQYIDEVVKYAL
jgi:polysaccharide deacetylase family protein (PEP-CTERM system associated)